MFSLSTPYTKEEGAAIPVQFLNPNREVIFETKGLLVTGSADCLINTALATQLSLGKSSIIRIAVSDGATTIEHEVLFRAVDLQRNVILGMSFMQHFHLVFDGPNKLVTITEP